MRISIATDHAGLEFSRTLVDHLTNAGHEIVDHGPKEYDALDNYPAFCINAAQAVARDRAAGVRTLGVVFGGSGNGEQIAANKVVGIRAALVWSMDTAILAREHNDANVISIGARRRTVEEAHPLHRRVHRRAVLRRRAARAALRAALRVRDHGRHRRQGRRRAPCRPRPAPPRSRNARGPLRPSHHPAVRTQLRRSRRARVEPAGPVRGRRRRDRRARDGPMPAPWASRCSSASRATCGCGCTSGCTVRGTSRATSSMDATIASANGRMGQTNQKGTFLGAEPRRRGVRHRGRENSLTSIGAPRRTRLRMSESEKEGNALEDVPARADRPGSGAPAHRHDRRRPARPDGVRGARCGAGRSDRAGKLGPDPLIDSGSEAEERFTRVIRRKPTAIALLLIGPGCRRRHRQCLPRRVALQGPGRTRTLPADRCPRSTCVISGATRREAARHRRRDGSDDDHGRPRPRRVPRLRWPTVTIAIGCTSARACRAGYAGRISCSRSLAVASSTGALTARRDFAGRAAERIETR